VPAYALLVRPAANRVFGGDARRLLRSELMAVDQLRGGRIESVGELDLVGVPYLAIDGEPDLQAVAALSSTYALFERTDDGLLRPVALPAIERHDDDLVTIQRYVGKTNETLTRLLLNLALAAAGARTGRVLDPMCGRGTTLNQALLLGCDAYGVDLADKDTAAYATFLTTWLQDKRTKHQVDRTAGRHRFRVTIGHKRADEQQTVDVATADTTEAPALFGRNKIDAVVTDLPYGVQHGSRSGRDLSRRPGELLELALPAWRVALRPGGGLAMSWNTKGLGRADAVSALESAGFEVPDLGADVDFVHRVDRVITRDVVVARRPR
jgi:SAM-dependent methyltransferase